MDALTSLFTTDGYLPHGFCLTWNPALLWTTVLSDATMVLAYGSYPIAVTYLVWKRPDMQYRWLYLAFFNGFILTCTATHFMGVVTVWKPLYWLAADVKLLSAIVAVATVFAVWWVIPRVLTLPSPAELRTQRSAALYARSLIEASLDPLLVISQEGKITDVNLATERATGMSRGELIGTDFSDYFTEPDKARDGYRQVLREGALTDYALALRHRDGHVADVLYNASVYRDESGNVAGVFAAARDITERKRAEAQISERVKELQAFFHLSELAERENLEPETLYREVVEALPESWAWPEIACARIVVGDSEFRTANFAESEWMQSAPLRVHGEVIGKIEVGYLEPRPVREEGPFLMEERQLLNAIAERVGRITERLRAEEELRSASLYARSLVEASLDPLVTISPEGKITDVNEATVEATGVPRRLLIGSDFSDYFTQPEKARAGYEEVFARGFVVNYPLALRHVSGRVMEVLYNASVYRDKKGAVAGVFAAARDVTERKRAEERLRSASLYARSLIEASPDPLVTISPEGKITDANEATIRATGVPREALLGSDFSDYFTEPDKARAGYQEVFAMGFVKDYPLALRHVSGKVTEVLYNASVYRDEKGGVAGVFAAARDVTDRKRAEEEIRELNRELERRVAQRTAELAEANTKLRRSTDFLEKLIESIPEPMFYKDREGVYRGGNQAFFDYLGKPRDAVVGQDVYGISPKHLADTYKKADDELMERGGAQAYESRVQYADGTEHDVIFHKATYPNPDGSVGGLIGTILDISERKRNEEERERLLSEIQRRAASLDEANKELEGFAYSVSHDLRTPLRAIDGYSNLLLKHYPDKLDDEGKRYLNVVRDNTKKMAQLIDDILAFSRMGRVGMEVAEIDMAGMARTVFEELQPGLAGRELTMDIQALPACRGDQAMLRQVWANLLGNAVKFTRRQADARIEVGGRTEGAEHIYYVKDNGAGFDMQYAEKLFGVFQRLHGVEEFEGTGIGLAIVKRIVLRHGGRVWAEGKVGEGATIYFALPV